MIRFIFKILTTVACCLISIDGNSQTLVINEFVASNFLGLADEDGDNEDWIEIVNLTENQINLFNFGLSDNASDIQKWQFPEVFIQPGEYLIVFASGKNRLEGELHTNFKISASGEDLILSNPSGVILDFIAATEVPTNFSYGKHLDQNGTLLYFDEPTPGQPNTSQGFTQLLSAPAFSHESGFYDSPFNLSLSNTENGVNYHYTIDGSEPTQNDPLFPSSLFIADISENQSVISLIPTTSSSVPTWYRWYPPIENSFKGVNIRVKGYAESGVSPSTITGNYFVHPNANEKYDLPVVALTMDSDDLFGTNGIYLNFDQRGIAWERPAHIQFFEPDGNLGFETGLGLRVHGGNSRRFALKSFRLYFRNAYGQSTISYPIFNDIDFNIHERLILRNSGSDWARTYFRDAFVQDILSDFSSVERQGFQPTISFVNGEFWGILNFRTRYDDNFLRLKYNVENYDLLEGTSSTVHGDNADYIELRNFLQNNDLNEFPNYQTVQEKMDVENFCDYHILQIFSMNTDQPGKNVRFWKSPELDNKWRWMWFDLDDSFLYGPHCSYDRNGLVFCTGLDQISAPSVNPSSDDPVWAPNGPLQTAPLRSLLKSNEFKTYFINRFADLLNTAFQPHYLADKIDSIYAYLSPYMEDHYHRWHRPEPAFHQEHINYLYAFANNRSQYMRNHIVDFFELSGMYELTLSVATGEGYIHLNTIAIDSITPTIPSASSPWQGTYFNDIPITLKAIPREGYVFSHWDGFLYSTEEEITISSDAAIYMEAHFLPSDPTNTIIEESFVDCTIYPNPTNGTVHVLLGDESLLNGFLYLNSFSGKNILEKEITTAHFQVDLSNLPSGVYLMQLHSKTGEVIRKKIVLTK